MIPARPCRWCARAALLLGCLSLGWLSLPEATAEAQARGRRPSGGRSASGRSASGRTSRRSGRRSRARGASGRGQGTTRGRTRRRGRRRRWRRRTTTRVRLRPGVDHDDCSYVRGDWCYRERVLYYGDSLVGFGLSLGVVGGLFDTGLNGLGGDRVVGDGVSAGVLPTLGIDARMWLGWGRARFGAAMQLGWAGPPTQQAALERGVFEEGSQLADGMFLGVWGIGAYQPHLSDLVQLWLGARAGFYLARLGVVTNGRRYASVVRPAFSAGPELGVRLSADVLGVMFQGFADLAQPGHGQLVVSFVFEEPKPPGAAW